MINDVVAAAAAEHRCDLREQGRAGRLAEAAACGRSTETVRGRGLLVRLRHPR